LNGHLENSNKKIEKCYDEIKKQEKLVPLNIREKPKYGWHFLKLYLYAKSFIKRYLETMRIVHKDLSGFLKAYKIEIKPFPKGLK